MTGVAGDRARLDRRRPMTTTKVDGSRGIVRCLSGYYSFTVLHGTGGRVTIGGFPCETAAREAADREVERLRRQGLDGAHRAPAARVDMLDEWIELRIAARKAERGGGPPKRITRWGDLDYLTDEDDALLDRWHAARAARQEEKERAWWDRRRADA